MLAKTRRAILTTTCLVCGTGFAVAAWLIWPKDDDAGFGLAAVSATLIGFGVVPLLTALPRRPPVPRSPLLSQVPRRARKADRRTNLFLFACGCLGSAGLFVDGLVTGQTNAIAEGAAFFVVCATVLALSFFRVVRPSFNLNHCLGLLEEWRLDEATEELELGRRSLDPGLRKLVTILGPFTTALRGDLAGYERAHASAVEAELHDMSWVTLGHAVYAARRRDWPTVLETLDCTLVGLDEQPQAIAEALRCWALSPDGPPRSTLKPVVICGLAGLDGVARVWPELVEYLKRRPAVSALN